MGATSIWHWIILLVVVVLLFGSGRISSVMADVAKGIKSFKKGMAEDEDETPAKSAPKTIDHNASTAEKTTESQGSKAG